MDEGAFWIQAVQSGAITVGFLYLTWHIPSMYRAWIENRDKERGFLASEREMDRQARHKQASEATTLLLQTWNENQKTVDKVIQQSEKREETLRREFLNRLEKVCRYGREDAGTKG